MHLLSGPFNDTTQPIIPVQDGKERAFEKMTKAIEEYFKFCPERPQPTGKPVIQPMLLHASPNSFHAGFNMMLESGGYMPGKIPVVVVPARPEDLKKYYRKKTVRTLLQSFGL